MRIVSTTPPAHTDPRHQGQARRAVRATLAVAAALALAGPSIANTLAADVETRVETSAQTWPEIAAVRFEGNDVTREGTMLRELPLAVGDAADPEAVDAGRQALLDLELFREVEARTEPRDDGRVDLVYRVRERRYLLPIPRVDTSSDENVSYGVQLRWANVGGLNHRLNAFVERGTFPEDQRRREERTVRLGYDAPFLIRDRYELQVDLEHLDRVTPRGDTTFDERVRRLEVLVADDWRTGRPRDGWTVGAGLLLDDRELSGVAAPPSDGFAAAVVGVANYSDERYHVYSETGRRLKLRVESASSSLGSDYSYSRLTAEGVHAIGLGELDEHETVRWLGSAGVVVAGRGNRDEFGLGGSGSLRGYPSDFLVGNRYAYGAVEYLRPIRWDWLRLLVVAEAGAADDDIAGLADGQPRASLGVGLRIRLPWFIGVEFEVGVAKPLSGGDVRVFAGGN